MYNILEYLWTSPAYSDSVKQLTNEVGVVYIIVGVSHVIVCLGCCGIRNDGSTVVSEIYKYDD